MFYGSYIFEFFGVLFKWLLQFPIYLFKRIKIKSFTEIWSGPKSDNGANGANELMYGVSNIFLGAVVIAVLIYFILWMGW